MKKALFTTLLSALCLGGMVMFSNAQESRSLWPDGKMPYPEPTEKGTKEAEAPTLHLYPTKGAKTHTGAAVVICPGGGYGGLATDHEGRQPAEWFNAQGVSAYVLHYRLGTQGYHYPSQLADVQRAIRWVRANAADQGLDPHRIAVMGFSAGGHLASMAATLFDEKAYDVVDSVDESSARPDFAILCYPVITFDSEVTHSGSRKNLFGPDRDGDEALAKKLSSELNVTDRTPPTFIFQTDSDTVVPAENAVRFYLALRAHKVPAEMHIYETGPHGVGLYLSDPVLGTWPGHLSAWLRANFFFAPAKARTAVSGSVKLDGTPVSWGALIFRPEDPNLPPTAVRVRKGKFNVKTDSGPVIGRSTLELEGSIWEDTRSDADQTVRLNTLRPGDSGPLSLELNEEAAKLQFEYHSR